jgi:Helix-turn-helix domain
MKRILKHERQIIERMLKEGHNFAEIGRFLGRTRGSIKQEIFRAGGKNNYNAEQAEAAAIRRMENMCSKLRVLGTKKISDEQKEIMKRGIDENWSLNKIRVSAGVGRSALDRFVKENHILRPTGEMLGNTRMLYERIKMLEMQLEIIIDQIKELTNVRNTENN